MTSYAPSQHLLVIRLPPTHSIQPFDLYYIFFVRHGISRWERFWHGISLVAFPLYPGGGRFAACIFFGRRMEYFLRGADQNGINTGSDCLEDKLDCPLLLSPHV
jgi:hypothetical protein